MDTIPSQDEGTTHILNIDVRKSDMFLKLLLKHFLFFIYMSYAHKNA